jgi:heme/copper-type cytochrome/quinol oxidase subunit 3
VNTSLFYTTFFTLTGFHGLHVALGLVAIAIMTRLALSKSFGDGSARALKAVGLYWHFVDVVWVVVFGIVYLRGLL